MNSSKLKIKISHYIILFIVTFILGILIYNLFFLTSNNNQKNVSNGSINKSDEVSEIALAPFIFNSKINSKYYSDVKDYDIKVSILSDDYSDNIKENIHKHNPTVLMGSSSMLHNLDNLQSYRIATENKICETDLNNNKLAYIYIKGSPSNLMSLSATCKIISKYKKQNYAIIIYIDSEKSIDKKFIDKLSANGALIIFTKGNNNSTIEMDSNTLIIYNLIENSDSYIPTFDLLYKDNTIIGIGIKIYINDESSKEEILNKINSNAKGITKELKDSFCFFDIN